MLTDILNCILLFLSMFFVMLYGMTFQLSRGTMWENWRDKYTSACDFAFTLSLILILAAAVLLGYTFKWWIPIFPLFLGTHSAVFLIRRMERVVLLYLGKFLLIVGYAILVVLAIRLTSQL